MSGSPAHSRILISRMKFIGDIILTTPLVRAVRETFPGAFIAYLGEKKAVALLEENPCLDEIIGYDFERPAVLEQTRIALLLRKRRFDLAIDLFGNPRSALVTRLSGARVRVGPDRPGRGRLYTVRIRDDGSPKTAIEFHDQFVRPFGVPPATAKTEIHLTPDERLDAEKYLRTLLGREISHPLVGIHPGATWPAKQWIAERFGGLADRCSQELGGCVIVTGGPGDGDAVRTVIDASARKPVRIPVVSLRQLAALISVCDVFVSNDAGPMHIAPATGTPVVGLFGPGEEKIWFPYDADGTHISLRRDVPCHPCHLDFCNRSGDGFMECMKLLTLDDVFNAVLTSLRSRTQSSVH